MSFFRNFFQGEDKNRLRISRLINQAKVVDPPPGWWKKSFAIGGLTDVGFSKNYPDMLLVISSQGRGVYDCSKLELVERDRDISWSWRNTYELWALGIGNLMDETIMVSGLHGGGLPLFNKYGDGIQNMSINWPLSELIFEPNHKSIYREDEGKYCIKIFTDYELRAYGFSFSGEYFITATSSEVNIYRRENGA